LEFQDESYAYLEKVQVTTTYIGNEIDVRDMYGLGCSSRQGVTAHVKVMEVSSDVVRAVHR
jgi:hypothetical protein